MFDVLLYVLVLIYIYIYVSIRGEELRTFIRTIRCRRLFLELDLDFLVGSSFFDSCWYDTGRY